MDVKTLSVKQLYLIAAYTIVKSIQTKVPREEACRQIDPFVVELTRRGIDDHEVSDTIHVHVQERWALLEHIEKALNLGVPASSVAEIATHSLDALRELCEQPTNIEALLLKHRATKTNAAKFGTNQPSNAAKANPPKHHDRCPTDLPP